MILSKSEKLPDSAGRIKHYSDDCRYKLPILTLALFFQIPFLWSCVCCLGSVVLCLDTLALFFRRQKPLNPTYLLIIKELAQNYPFSNWVCFFKFIYAIRITQYSIRNKLALFYIILVIGISGYQVVGIR